MAAPDRVRRLRARTVPVRALSADTVEAMLALFARYYEDVDPAVFRADLAAKQQAILLTDVAGGTLVGFSTVRVLGPGDVGRACRVVYSGDTVVDRDYWGGVALQVAFLRLLVRQRLTAPTRPLYWLLTTKGFRTYLLMANNLPAAWPRWDRAEPADLRVLRHHLGRLRYGDDYDDRTGVVRHSRPRDRLRSGVGEITEREREVPAIRFFAEANPGHADGDELVCLARIRHRDLPRLAAKFAARAVARRAASRTSEGRR